MYVLNYWTRSPKHKESLTDYTYGVCEKHRDADAYSTATAAAALATEIDGRSACNVSNSTGHDVPNTRVMKRRTSGNDLLLLHQDQQQQQQLQLMNTTEQVPCPASSTTSTSATDTTWCRFCIAASTNPTSTITSTSSAIDNKTKHLLQQQQQQHHHHHIDSENYMLRGVGLTSVESPRVRSYSFTNGANKTPISSNNYHVPSGSTASKHTIDEQQQQPQQQARTLVDMDMFCVRETVSSLAITTTTTEPPSTNNNNNITSVSDSVATSSSSSTGTITSSSGGILVGTSTVGLVGTNTTGTSTSCARTLSFHELLCTCHMSCCCMCGSLCSPDCHACFHSLCVRFAANYVCQRKSDVLPPATLNHDKVSIHTPDPSATIIRMYVMHSMKKYDTCT